MCQVFAYQDTKYLRNDQDWQMTIPSGMSLVLGIDMVEGKNKPLQMSSDPHTTKGHMDCMIRKINKSMSPLSSSLRSKTVADVTTLSPRRMQPTCNIRTAILSETLMNNSPLSPSHFLFFFYLLIFYLRNFFFSKEWQENILPS